MGTTSTSKPKRFAGQAARLTCLLAALAGTGLSACTIHNDPPRSGVAVAINDTTILAGIHKRFAGHSEFDGVTTDVIRGRVLLTGLALSAPFAKAAENEARKVPGIVSLHNEIQVGERGARGYANDKWISTKVKTALVTDFSLDGLSVGVETVRGVVYLTGVVPTVTQRDKAIAIARGISGVVKVVSALQTSTRD